MGLGVTKNGSGGRGGKVSKLTYTFPIGGGQMVIPGNSLITWMVLDSVLNNDVTMGTAAYGVDFFNDTVDALIPYEDNKGWKVKESTTIYVICNQVLTVTLYKL